MAKYKIEKWLSYYHAYEKVGIWPFTRWKYLAIGPCTKTAEQMQKQLKDWLASDAKITVLLDGNGDEEC